MRMVPIGNQECSCLRQICSSLNDLFGFPYYNIGNLFVGKFCPHIVHWHSQVANFTRDGNGIISENYISNRG